MKHSSMFLVIMAAMSLHCAAQSQWTMFSRDRECTSWAKGDAAFAPPFTIRLIPAPWSQPVTVEPRISFLTSVGGRLYGGMGVSEGFNIVSALDPVTGLSPWTVGVPSTGGGIGMSPVISGETVIAGGQGQSAHLIGIDRQSGVLKWDRLFGSMYARQAIVDGNRVYIRADSLYSIDPTNGQTIWVRRIQGGYSGAGWPALDDSRLYFSYADTLFASSKIDGAIIWRSAGASSEGLSVDGQHVYVATSTGIRAARKSDGQTVWSHTVPDGKKVAYIDGSGLAIDDTHLAYVVWKNRDTVGTLTVLNKTTGAQIWTQAFMGEGMCSPTIVNGMVFAVNWTTHELWGFDISSGAVRFHDDTHGYATQPIIAGGKMYVGSWKGGSTGWSVIELTPSANEVHRLPDEDVLSVSAYPNPCSQQSTVSCILPRSVQIRLSLHDALGRQLAVLEEAFAQAGLYFRSFSFDGLPITAAAGVYYLKLVADGRTAMKLLVHQP